MAERHFSQASLEYVFLLQEVQERKKFEFVETVIVWTIELSHIARTQVLHIKHMCILNCNHRESWFNVT